MQIYLDYGATTPLRPEALAVLQEAYIHQWGNPSSLHHWGQRSATVVEEARIRVSELIEAINPERIIFTGGGTEADNLAIMGVAKQYSQPRHIITSSVEHSAIEQPLVLLEKQGWRVTRLPVDKEGRIHPLQLEEAITTDTVLISIIYGQNEIGTLQPIQELGEIARRYGVLFHTDAIQVVGKIPINVQTLPVDMLSISGHKIYATQGVGALYLREGVELFPLLLGGAQESGLRGGTQAVAAIATLGVAALLAKQELSTETPRLITLRNKLFELLADCPYLVPTGSRYSRLPHHVSFIVTSGVTGRAIVREMNLAGIGISGGSACNSGKLTPSSVLLAMGYSQEASLGGIRLTLGRDTTEADIDWCGVVLKQVLHRLKSFSG